MDAQRTDGIEHGENHHADIRENRRPHVGYAQSTQRKAAKLDHQRKDDVLVDNADALAGNLHRLGNLHRVIVHQHDIRRFDGGVRTHRAHGNADVCAG